MNTRRRLRLSSLSVLAIGLLLAAPSSGSQATNTSRSTQRRPDTLRSTRPKNGATLMLMVDRNGFAQVTLWLTTKLDDPGRVRQALQQSLTFPITFDERANPAAQDDFQKSLDDMTADVSWTFVKGRSDRSLSNQGMKSTTRMTFAPLINELHSVGIKRLSIGIVFEDPDAEVTLTGGTRVGTGNSELSLNYYRAEIDLDTPKLEAIEFSYGYNAPDIWRRTLPLLAFVLFPPLLTLWIRRSVLKYRDQPEEMWGRYFRFWALLLSFIWLIWMPICAWSGLSEVVMSVVGRDRRMLVQVFNIGIYLLPPLLSLCLCHLLSKPVYDRVTGMDWSARDVMRRAMVTTAVGLLPLFVIVIVIGMFNLSSRFTGMFLIVAVVGWLLSLTLINRVFKSSFHAVSEGAFRNRVFELAHKAGVAVKQIYLLPESTSQLSNAFASSDNSVMITVSLLKHLSKREVDAIMAHEIGHLKEKHPQMRGHITLGAIMVTTIVASSISSLISMPRSGPALFSFALLASMLILHFVSRSNERHADAIGISLTGDPEAFISGLAKLSRLNLMPLKGGGWGESLETHPRTMNRLQDIARLHGISPPRFEELLAAADLTESHYSAIADDGVQGKIFSTDFKKKYTARRALLLLASILLPPLLFAFLLPRLPLPGAVLAITYAGGLIVTLGFYQIVRNLVSNLGQRSLEQRLRARLKQQGFAAAARDGIAVGLSPAVETRKYENYLFWDIGILWLTKDKLYYLGEESQFAFERWQVQDVYQDKARAEWLADKSLYLRWYSPQREVSDTLHFLALGASSVLQGRRQLGSLHEQVRAWIEQNGSFPVAPESLPLLKARAVGAITSEPASNKFNLGLILKASMTITGLSAVLSFAFRLSYSGGLYATAVAILICFIDESPKLFHRPRPADVVGPAKPKAAPQYQPGAWAESNVATVTQDIP
jgi:Zn-dependent protease with chaperone function